MRNPLNFAQVGDNRGRQIHVGIDALKHWAIESNPINPERAITHLDSPPAQLSTEGLAAYIAADIYRDQDLELGNTTLNILNNISRIALAKSRLLCEDRLVQYSWQPNTWVPQIQSVSLLARAFDAGMTEADLIAAGVPIEIVIQLKWWHRRPEETLLQQHIRAELAGWTLPVLAAAYRENWVNLLNYLNSSSTLSDYKITHQEQLNQIVEVINFFDKLEDDTFRENPEDEDFDPNPGIVWIAEPGDPLSAEQEKAWANAFAGDLSRIFPDMRGRWDHLPKTFLSGGRLAEPLTTLARYLDYRGIFPNDWLNDQALRDSFFRTTVRFGEQ